MTYVAGDTAGLGERLTQTLGRWLHENGYPVPIDEAAGLASAALEVITPLLSGKSTGGDAESVAAIDLLNAQLDGALKGWEVAQDMASTLNVRAAGLTRERDEARAQLGRLISVVTGTVHKLMTGVDMTPEQAGEWARRPAPRVWRKGDEPPSPPIRVRAADGTVLVAGDWENSNWPARSRSWHVEGKRFLYAPWYQWIKEVGPLTEILDPAPAEPPRQAANPFMRPGDPEPQPCRRECPANPTDGEYCAVWPSCTFGEVQPNAGREP